MQPTADLSVGEVECDTYETDDDQDHGECMAGEFTVQIRRQYSCTVCQMLE